MTSVQNTFFLKETTTEGSVLKDVRVTTDAPTHRPQSTLTQRRRKTKRKNTSTCKTSTPTISSITIPENPAHPLLGRFLRCGFAMTFPFMSGCIGLSVQ
jgi:hypothetical protein